MVKTRSTPPGRCGDRVEMRCIPDPFGDWNCRLYDAEAKTCGTARIGVVGRRPFEPSRISFFD